MVRNRHEKACEIEHHPINQRLGLVCHRHRLSVNIHIHTELTNENLLIRFHDHGKSLALERIRKIALENGLIKDLAAIDDETTAELIFSSGLSTAQAVSNISGRGVGTSTLRLFEKTLDT